MARAMVLFGYMAAITKTVEFSTGILVGRNGNRRFSPNKQPRFQS